MKGLGQQTGLAFVGATASGPGGTLLTKPGRLFSITVCATLFLLPRTRPQTGGELFGSATTQGTTVSRTLYFVSYYHSAKLWPRETFNWKDSRDHKLKEQ